MSKLRERTTALALGDFVNTGLIALLAVVLTRLLSKDDYGTYRQVLLAYTLAMSALGAHLPESLLYLLPRAPLEEHPRWLGQTLLLSTGFGIAIAATLWMGAGLWGTWTGNPQVTDLVRIFALFAVADRVVRMVAPALVAEDQAPVAAGFTIAAGLARVVSTLAPCAAGWSLGIIFWTGNLAWLVVACAGVTVVALLLGLSIERPRAAMLRGQMAYVSPLMASGVVAALHEQLGPVVAATILSAADFAEYAVGAVQIPLVGIWIGSIGSAMLPDLVRMGTANERDGMLRLWQRGTRKGAFVVFPIAAWVLVAPDLLVRVLYGPAYGRAAVPMALFALILRGIL